MEIEATFSDDVSLLELHGRKTECKDTALRQKDREPSIQISYRGGYADKMSGYTGLLHAFFMATKLMRYIYCKYHMVCYDSIYICR